MSLNQPILVIGATGYVGKRLILRLLERGYRVRAGARSIDKLSQFLPKDPRLAFVSMDVLDRDSLKHACNDCGVVYYLVHSMKPGEKHFDETDKKAAENMVWAAEEAFVGRLIYLAGLGEDSENLSKHLKSRREVETILKSGKVPATILRAAMIIGSGSASFEILRYLVERLPVMITPRWVSTECQPIAIRNVLEYLVSCLEVPKTAGETFDIGAEDVLTYRQLMEIYAEEAKLLKRFVILVPVLTPRLSSYWIHLVTPIHASLARPLAEGLRNKVVCHENRIRELIPQRLLSAREAIQLALGEFQNQLLGIREEITFLPPEWSAPGDPSWAGGTRFEDKRKVVLKATPDQVWKPLQRIGGKIGWYYADWLWQFRGFLDRLIGGVGMRKGRTHSRELNQGDAIDFWRVEKVEPRKRLLLFAEMKLPGSAILDFQIKKISDETTELSQTARFIPRGLTGLLYWYLVAPLHQAVFSGMLRGISMAVEKYKVVQNENLGSPAEKVMP